MYTLLEKKRTNFITKKKLEQTTEKQRELFTKTKTTFANQNNLAT